ncbi:unnamed protein product [Rotaria sp. Silwood2]|nr:unnamed protein product [Rotaria sp. Silwood2]
MTDEDRLRLYEKHFNKYTRACKILNGACHYLNRHWVRRQYDNGRRNVYEINELANQIWKETFFKPIFPNIIQTCLNLIKEHRINKLSIDIETIKKIIEIYADENFNKEIKESIDKDSTSEPITDIYKQYFEIKFVQDAEDFYRQQKILCLESNSIMEDLTQISKNFDEEINFVKLFLPKFKSTFQMLINKLEEIFLPDHNVNLIKDKMETIVSAENSQEIRHLCELVRQIPKIKRELTQLIENHIYQFGINTIEKISETAINDPNLYIETIFDIYERFFKLFCTEPSFNIALDKTCCKFINNNAVTEKSGTTTKSAELLARYCDTLLKKGFYGKMLSRRLVNQLSASDDYEKLMISKLKETCSFQYTSKFERMVQDVDVSKNLMDEYQIYCTNKNLKSIVDFSVMVLSSNSWPFSPLPNVILPIELKETFDNFKDFYTHHHCGRKLILLYQYSKGELQICFTKQKYTLQVSTYEIIVLLLFNEKLNWTVEEIQDKTQIQSDLLLQVVCSLLKIKILFSKEISENFQDNDIKMNHTIELKEDFTSEKLRINLNMPLKSTKQKDLKSLNKSINEDRKLVIQAAIIRIMKERKTLKHSLLMQEVLEHLSSRFKSENHLIKKCIDILIDKEYLERNSDNKEILHYLT